MRIYWLLGFPGHFLASLVLSDLQVKLVPVMPCALCTPQILYRLSRSSYSNLNDPHPLPPQRFCILSHSTYSNLNRLTAGEIAWLSFVQKTGQKNHIFIFFKDLKPPIIGLLVGTLMWYDPSSGRRVLDTKSILGFSIGQLPAASCQGYALILSLISHQRTALKVFQLGNTSL